MNSLHWTNAQTSGPSRSPNQRCGPFLLHASERSNACVMRQNGNLKAAAAPCQYRAVTTAPWPVTPLLVAGRFFTHRPNSASIFAIDVSPYPHDKHTNVRWQKSLSSVGSLVTTDISFPQTGHGRGSAEAFCKLLLLGGCTANHLSSVHGLAMI
jgi:hypothetical protein